MDRGISGHTAVIPAKERGEKQAGPINRRTEQETGKKEGNIRKKKKKKRVGNILRTMESAAGKNSGDIRIAPI